MLLHCLSGLSACSQISQSWYSPWHTNAASPRLAETKILTFSILMWPRQQKATSQPADKPQCLFLSPKPFCLPLKEQRLLRTGQAVALRVRHCPPPACITTPFPHTDQFVPEHQHGSCWEPGRAQPPQELQHPCPGPRLPAKHPAEPCKSHFVPLGLPQALTRIIWRSGKGQNHGNSPMLQASYMVLGHPAPPAPPARTGPDFFPS